MLLGVSCMVVGRRGAAQGGTRVTGRVTLLEKDSRPSRDLGAAVVYFDAATPAGRAVTDDVAINDKEFVPRVVVLPAGSTVRHRNQDRLDHNVFSGSRGAGFELGS